MGFEPTRAEPIGLAVQRLNHSATSSLLYPSAGLLIMIVLNAYFHKMENYWKFEDEK